MKTLLTKYYKYTLYTSVLHSFCHFVGISLPCNTLLLYGNNRYGVLCKKKLSFVNAMKTQLRIICFCQQFFTKINFVHLLFPTVKNLLCVHPKTTPFGEMLDRMHNKRILFMKHYKDAAHSSYISHQFCSLSVVVLHE